MVHIRNVGGVSPLPFFILLAVINVVTTGNGMGTKNVFKWNRALEFEFLVSSVLSTALLL